MEEFEDYTESFNYDIHRLSSERNKRLNRYINRNLKEPEKLIIDLSFTLSNTFWGNSWSCAEKLEIIKGKSHRTSVNIHCSHTVSEIWDCRIMYYNSPEDHNIYIRSLDCSITIQIYNNIFTCTGIETHAIEGFVSDTVTAL